MQTSNCTKLQTCAGACNSVELAHSVRASSPSRQNQRSYMLLKTAASMLLVSHTHILYTAQQWHQQPSTHSLMPLALPSVFVPTAAMRPAILLSCMLLPAAADTPARLSALLRRPHCVYSSPHIRQQQLPTCCSLRITTAAAAAAVTAATTAITAAAAASAATALVPFGAPPTCVASAAAAAAGLSGAVLPKRPTSAADCASGGRSVCSSHPSGLPWAAAAAPACASGP
jgi:hypothetical protein